MRQALHPYFVPQFCARSYRIRGVKQFDVGAYMLGAPPGSANFAMLHSSNVSDGRTRHGDVLGQYA